MRELAVIEEQNSLGKQLVGKGIFSVSQLQEALMQAAEKQMPLSRYLIESGRVPKNTICEILAGLYGVTYVDLSNFQVSHIRNYP